MPPKNYGFQNATIGSIYVVLFTFGIPEHSKAFRRMSTEFDMLEQAGKTRTCKRPSERTNERVSMKLCIYVMECVCVRASVCLCEKEPTFVEPPSQRMYVCFVFQCLKRRQMKKRWWRWYTIRWRSAERRKKNPNERESLARCECEVLMCICGSMWYREVESELKWEKRRESEKDR